jgi:hypothetical protein
MGGTRTPEPSTRRASSGLTAVVTDVSAVSYATGGPPEESVAGSFDCEATAATVDGVLRTSSCRTVALGALSRDSETDRVTLSVFPKWDASDPPGEVDCGGAAYGYSVRIEAMESLPTELAVVHVDPDRDGGQRTFVVSSEC